MTARPILFSGPMVRALLDGRKTQTRRVLEPVESHRLMCRSCGVTEREFKADLCKCEGFALEWTPCMPPSYRKGDLLWVREAWRVDARFDRYKPSELPRTAHPNLDYLATAKPDDLGLAGKTRTSFFMPRWASRLTLRVTEVRVQRLQEIEYDDAISEGMEQRKTCLSPGTGTYAHDNDVVDDFRALWDSLNAKRDGGAFSWASNPWVVAVSFEVIRANVTQVMEASDG